MDKNLLERAIQLAQNNKESFSISLLQREFKIGYIACTKLMIKLEEEGVVATFDPNRKGRQVLI